MGPIGPERLPRSAADRPPGIPGKARVCHTATPYATASSQNRSADDFSPGGSEPSSRPRSVQKLKITVVVSETRSKHGLRAPSHSTLFRDSGRIRCRVAEDGYGQP